MHVVVVGAGISGLAAAYELQRRGATGDCARGRGRRRGPVGGPRADLPDRPHRPAAVRAGARGARAAGCAWEREFGVGRAAGRRGPRGRRAATAASACGRRDGSRGRAVRAARPRRDPRRGFRCSRADHPGTAGSGTRWPAACGSGARSTRSPRGSTVRRATVDAVDGDGRVRIGDEVLAADAVLVCAGLGTQALVAPLGLDFELRDEPHVRVTYAAGGTAACVIPPSSTAPDRQHRALRDRDARPERRAGDVRVAGAGRPGRVRLAVRAVAGRARRRVPRAAGRPRDRVQRRAT